MAEPVTIQVAPPADTRRSIGRSLLLTVPILLWALLMFSRSLQVPGASPKIAGLVVLVFMVTLFFLMVRTKQTYRWRRVFFVSLGLLFPIGFIWDLLALRGSMSIPIEKMISGDTPFCFLAIPMMIIPAALAKTLAFPGSILPSLTNPHAFAPMVALWFAATIVLGKGWCAYGCFFGGIEEGFAALPRKPRIKTIDPRWRWAPWGVLAAIVLISAATFEPFYCMWICPFKAVTEFPEVNSATSALQAGIFGSLFVGLVLVLPFLTKLRTQCTILCPFGAFQSLFNKLSVFDVRIKPEQCTDCVTCRRACPTMSLDEGSVAKGRAMMSCMRCGACVDACTKDAVVWHVKGTSIDASPEAARLLYLYPAWAFATMFGGSIIANTVEKLVHLIV
jgi:ferredoxin-type protein NapH